ncbi:MAG: PAS domain S-box protein [Dehalococcoidia bacterium]
MLTLLIVVASLLIIVITAGLAVALSVAPGRRRIWRLLAFAFPVAMLVRLITLDQVLSSEAAGAPSQRTMIVIAALLMVLLIGLAGVVPHLLRYLRSSKALDESERRFEMVLDTMHNAVLVTDSDHNVVLVNRALCEMLGYSEEELLAVEPAVSLAHPDDRERMHRSADAVRRGDQAIVDCECRLIDSGGETVYVECRLTAFDLDGSGPGVLTEAENVTGRVLAQRALVQSREQLARAQEVARLGSWHWDLKTDEVRWSDEFYRICGWEPGEVKPGSRSFKTLLSDDDSKIMNGLYASAARDGDPFEGLIVALRRSDGSDRTIEGQAEVTFDAEGRPETVIGIIHDVTERVAADGALRDSEERFRAVFETGASGIVVLDAGGRAIMLNSAVVEMLGYDRSELEQTPLAYLLRSEDRDASYEWLADGNGGGPRDDRQRMQLVRKDRELIDVDIHASPFTLQGDTVGTMLEVRNITDELALQRRVESSAAEIATILETAPDPIVRINERGQILRANAAVRAVFGWEPEDLTKQDISVLIGGEARTRHASYVEHYLKTGQASTAEGLVIDRTRESVGRRKDGMEFPIELNVAEVPGPPGAQREYTAVLRDISERFAVQRALRESEERFRTAFETAQNGMLLLARDGRTLLQNRALLEMLGMTPAGVVSFRRSHDRVPQLDDFMSRDDFDRLSAISVRRPGSTEPSPRARVSLRSLDGRAVEAEVTASTFNEGGAAIGTLVEVRDITDQLVAERSLRESEEHLQAVVDAVQSGLVIRDREGAVLWANQAVCDLLGCTADEFRSMPIEELITSEDIDLVRGRIGEAGGDVEHAGVHGATVRALRRDGTEIAMQVNSAPFTQGGEVVGVLAELNDVTESVRLREQLLQSQKLEAVGTLVAGVAHDFNNLLTAIGGSIELAREEQGESPWLERATVATDRAGQLVHQLLQFSRRTDATRRIVDLRALGQESADLLGETVDRRIAITVQDPGAPLPVWADQGQLQQVMMNLLVNSRDALADRMSDAELPADYVPRIEIHFESFEFDGESLAEFRVTDNGSGMTPEVRERIFDPFFTTKQVDEGTGLGLSTAYGIVTDHGGTMTVESTPGEGTTFIVRLPSPAPGFVDTDEGESATTDSLGPGAGERVLVVDDEPAVIEIAHQALSRAGYQVASAMGGDGALRMSDDGPFDLVLLDVNMPAPNGWQTLHQLLKGDPHQRVLMLSGYALDDEARERGALGLLRKPFDAKMLVKAVEEALTV